MSWHARRLKFLAATPIRNGLGESGGQDDPAWPRYVRTTDIAGPRTMRDDVFASLPPEIARDAMLQRDDIVMTAAGATIGKSLLYQSDAPACYAGYLVRFRPHADVDPRFVSYWMESKHFWRQIEVGKVVSTIENFSASKYENLSILVPDLLTQHFIADYLDRETARIDALIEKKRRMVELLHEQCGATVEECIRALVESHKAMPLKYAARHIEVGIVITPSVWYAESGVLAIRGMNVKPGEMDLADVVCISQEGHRLHRKSMLHAGDVVVVRTGQAGAAAVVPNELEGCNCIDLVIVRTSPRLNSKFLEFVLNSDWTQKHVDEHSVGTIQSHFNVGAMKEVPVPVPPLDEQQKVVEQLTVATERTNRLVGHLTNQILLLAEHRQALITAAVIGDLDIPGVAA